MSFTFCLNTATIQPASLPEKIQAAAEAGYQAIELWVADVLSFLQQGGTLEQVRRMVDEAGLARPSMIHLKNWWSCAGAGTTEDWNQVRRSLEVDAALGSRHIVAGPPHQQVDLDHLAEDYHRLLEVSLQYGVPASLEYLGFVPQVNRLEVAWDVIQRAGHPAATVVVDTWHNFRGGTDPAMLERIPAEKISIVHWNDAPADIPRQQQADPDRVMPGDGILPLAEVASQLQRIGYRGALSLELFHRPYWEQDPRHVARLGLEKMKASLGQ